MEVGEEVGEGVMAGVNVNVGSGVLDGGSGVGATGVPLHPTRKKRNSPVPIICCSDFLQIMVTSMYGIQVNYLNKFKRKVLKDAGQDEAPSGQLH